MYIIIAIIVLLVPCIFLIRNYKSSTKPKQDQAEKLIENHEQKSTNSESISPSTTKNEQVETITLPVTNEIKPRSNYWAHYYF